ncbi:Cupin, RmlC-type [Rhypophila sp. PSN 637]
MCTFSFRCLIIIESYEADLAAHCSLKGAVGAVLLDHPDRSFAIEASLDLIKGSEFFSQRPPTHFHIQDEYVEVTQGKLIVEADGQERVLTAADGRVVIKPYEHHSLYPIAREKQDDGVTVVKFLLSGEITDSVFELNPVFFENWYKYQDEVVVKGKKVILIQVLSTFDAGGTYITLPKWFGPCKHVVAIALGVVVGRWIGGLLGYQPFYKEWTTDWELACRKMETSLFQRRFADRSKGK